MSIRAVVVAAVITGFVLGIVGARDGRTDPGPERTGTVHGTVGVAP